MTEAKRCVNKWYRNAQNFVTSITHVNINNNSHTSYINIFIHMAHTALLGIALPVN
jgi:hypothetical protein